jgi:drug/metabolite transporter (DMT)-like permease
VTRRGWALFVSLGIIWGLPYLLIKVAVEHVDPGFIVFVRVLLGALVLLPIVLARRQLGTLRGHLRWVAVFAVVEITFSFWALNWAEQRIASSLAAILIATVPTVGALLAWWAGLSSSLSAKRVAGLAVGFVGVGALVGLDINGSSWLAVAAVGITVLGYALGPVVIARWLSDLPSLPVIAAALALNAVIFAPVAWIVRPRDPVPPSTWAALAVLGLVCTALAFVLFFSLIREVGAPRAQVITYVNPAVAVLLGVVVLGEPITAGMIVGFPLVLLGSYLATRGGTTVVEPEP